MAFQGSKYDLELNNVSYRIRNYQKTEASPFIPRLGSGEQTESDFDLLKTKTIKGFAGGSLQRYWEDDTSVFASEGLYPIYDDGTLYPVNSPTAGTWIFKSYVMAVCQSPDYAFVASQTYNMPTTSIRRIDAAGNVVSLTLPANLSNMGTSRITDMCVSKTHLWIATGDYGRMYYMPLTTTTVTEVAAGTGGSPQLLAVWKENLYGTNANSGSLNFILSRYTGDTTTKNWVQVGRAGSETSSPNSRLIVFNNRLILPRVDGLFAYDGTAAGLTPIDDQLYAPHSNNFRHATPLKGSLIYWMPDGMYRYTGSMIEKLYDISEVGMPVHVNTGKNRLWMIYNNDSFNGSSRYDKSMGYDNTSSNNVDGRLMVFNGKALYTYARTSTWVKNPGTEDFSGQGTLTHVLWFKDTIRMFTLADKSSVQDVFTLSTNEQANTGSKPWRILTSIFDANFPMIDKTIENLEAVFDGNVAADEDILVEYRTAGFDGSSGWTTLCTLKSQSRIKEQVYNQIPAGITTKKIQFRFSGTTDVRYGISRLVFRYLLSPDLKWQWNFTALAYGDSTTQKLLLRDGSDDTQTVRALRGGIYAARQSDVPVIFLDVDQLDQNGTVNNSATTITLQDTSLLKDFGFVKLDDEIIYYAAKTSTTLTGCLRGRLGTTAASHTNAAVRPCYRVIVRQIPNERIEMDDGDNNLATNSDRASEIRVLIQEV